LKRAGNSDALQRSSVSMVLYFDNLFLGIGIIDCCNKI
jgi:hypothetical protein